MRPLDPMLSPRSVAIVGASERRGSVGDLTVRQLISGGFDGSVYPVNPGYETIAGIESCPTISDIGGQVDVAVLAVSNSQLETEVQRAVAAGARSLVIFASCHGTASDGSPLRPRITKIVNKAGIPVCGGNGMGFLNLEKRLRLCGFYQPEGLRTGGISFLTHSGSLFSAMLHNQRGLGFNLVVSTGLEMNTRMSDYFSWVLEQKTTRVVALFMETIRDPEGFQSALSVASERDIPVVALKVGATGRGKVAVATHSEALAGEDAVYDALFDRHGVHRVYSMDEMVDTMEIMSSPRRVAGGGLGVVHDSGGERALLIDTSERVGVPLPSVSRSTAETLAGVLDPGLEPENPVDAWGTGRQFEDVFVTCLEALAADPAIGAVAFSVDLTEEEDIESEYGAAVVRAAGLTEKPMLVLSHLTSAIDRSQAAYVRDHGIPVLEGTETALRAIRHLLDRSERASWPAQAPRLTLQMQATTHDPISLLSSYGIPVARSERASDMESAKRAAADIGYPVVLKTTAVEHKTDVDGVRLGIGDENDLTAAYEDISHRLGPEVEISRQVPPGVEIALGALADPQFGPIVLASAGGVLVETLDDTVALIPPVDAVQADRAIRRLRVAGVLEGARGSPPADLESLAEVVARFSEMVLDHSADIDSIDLNPVIVGPHGSTVVDVLVKRPK